MFLTWNLELGTWNAHTANSQVAQLQTKLDQEPDNLDHAYRLANALSWERRYEEALALYEKILTQKPDYLEAKAGIAKIHSWMGLYDQAAQEYEEMLLQNPDNYEAHSGLGNLALWANDFRRSVEHFKKALASNPRDALSHKGISRAYWGLGQQRLAEKHFVISTFLDSLKNPLRPIIIAALVIGSFFGLIFIPWRRHLRHHKEEVLKIELDLLRKTAHLYHERTGKFPLALEHLMTEDQPPNPGNPTSKKYLDWKRLDKKGSLIDPFNNRYWYNSETGAISTITAQYQGW